MTDIADFLPLLRENIHTIRARVDSDVNAGYSPEDSSFIDTVVGGFYFDLSQALILEIERLWDFLSTEVPGSAFVTTAWGEYLDEHGAVIGVPRHPALKATGSVTFTGTNGTVIPAGYTIALPAASADEDPVEFLTLEAVTISGTTATVDIEAAETGAEGNASSGTVTVLVSPISGLTSVTNPTATSGGADVESDQAYRDRLLVEYSSRQGAGSQDDYERWALGYGGIGQVSVIPLWAGAGTVRIVVTDTESNPVSSVVRDGLQNYLDPSPASTLLNGAATFPQGTIPVDSTVGFTDAGYIYIGSDGDYDRIKYTSKDATNFIGCTGGSGSQPDNAPVVQRGLGYGLAPIGHEVTVDTPSVLTVNVTATIDFEDGYSLDGAGGTTPLQDTIETAITTYIDDLKPGMDVLFNRVEARILNVRGVYNVGTASTPVALNGVSDDLAVADEEVAETGTITLTAL